MSVKFIDNSAAFKVQMTANIQPALTAMGEAFVKNAQREIQAMPRFGPGASGLGAIDTGQMLASNEYQVNAAGKYVLVGNTARSPQGAPYPLYVTVGTHKMPAREFLQNAVLNHGGSYAEAARPHLGKGF